MISLAIFSYCLSLLKRMQTQRKQAVLSVLFTDVSVALRALLIHEFICSSYEEARGLTIFCLHLKRLMFRLFILPKTDSANVPATFATQF